MSAVQIVEGGYYLTRDGVLCGPAHHDPHPWRPAYPWLLRVHASYIHPDVRIEYSDDGRYLRGSSVELPFDLVSAVVIGIDPGIEHVAEAAAPVESASATPAGGGGGSGEARDGGGASGTEAGPDIARLYGAGFLKPSAGEGSTPPPSGPAGLPGRAAGLARPSAPPLPGVEDDRSAAVKPLAWQWRSIGSWHTVSEEDVFDPEAYARRMAEASGGRYRPIYSAEAVADDYKLRRIIIDHFKGKVKSGALDGVMAERYGVSPNKGTRS